MYSYWKNYKQLTSNLNMAADPPKMEEAKCNQKSMERPDKSSPLRYRYCLRFTRVAAAEKHPNAMAVPTNALMRILHQQNQRKKSATTRLKNYSIH